MDNDSILGDDSGSLEHQTCYIYTPTTEAAVTPRKRRAASSSRTPKSKREKVVTDDAATAGHGFPTLLRGLEEPEAVTARFTAYQTLWDDVERRSNDVLVQVNEETLQAVSDFVGRAGPDLYREKLPTGLILTGPNIASHGSLFAQIEHRIRAVDRHGRAVVLTSKDSSNLKNVLKKIIKQITELQDELDDEDEMMEPRAGKKTSRYNYDPETIQEWCQAHPGSKVVVAVQDTEAFDPAVLVDTISILHTYLTKISFVLLLGIATSEDLFYEKLPRSTVRLMRGDRFDVQRFEESMAQVFTEAVLSPSSVLKLGPGISDSIFDRQRDHTRSIGTFLSALKYAYMSHFYANPLSIILAHTEDEASLSEALSSSHCEAIRNLPSFRRHIEALVPTSPSLARNLLTSDSALHSAVFSASQALKTYTAALSAALPLYRALQATVTPIAASSTHLYELYPLLLHGNLTTTPQFREILLLSRKLPSPKFESLITHLSTIPSPLQPLLSTSAARITHLHADKLANPPPRSTSPSAAGRPVQNPSNILITEHTIPEVSTHRTTMKSGRVRIEERKSYMTAQDTEFSTLQTTLLAAIEDYFKQSFRPYHEFFLHEIFFYDLRSPHREVFGAKPRPAVERALSRPGDYLGCECCNEQEDGVEGAGGQQPATAVLYQLYLESPVNIGVYDLWSAFKVVMMGDKAVKDTEEDDGDGEDEGEGEEEEALRAQFYRALAELRYLGFVKYSKKKSDHLIKLAWKGL